MKQKITYWTESDGKYLGYLGILKGVGSLF
jgi:hypothetical protein